MFLKFWALSLIVNISVRSWRLQLSRPRATFCTSTKDESLTSENHKPRSTEEVIDMYKDELAALRGTPELVDRLENLVSRYPGIEVDMSLYRSIYPFKLDQFQEESLTYLLTGNNVIVSTPTGSGKTVVGELAIYFALMMGLRVAYTTPLKALSNQKFQDFTNRYGGDRVGLLTGDIVINRGAPVTVMTTEVFRNMIYDQNSESQLSNLFMVCFDEFHYMNDPDRGTVWEESVISCPKSVRVLALSATMGNVDDIKGWISDIHGPTQLVTSDHRPVPLRYYLGMKAGLLPFFRDPHAGPGGLVGVKKGGGGKLDVSASLNPTILKIEEQEMQKIKQRINRQGRPFKTPKFNANNLIPKYSDVVEELRDLKLLPAIVFIFSRSGCESSAKLVLQAKLRLLSLEETAYVTQAINAFALAHTEIPILKSSVQMLRAGVGVHHAGLIPVWKAFIEDLFNANKIKILFATETLAAGVNMPARTTIISSVTKRFNSEIVRLKTSQLLQMAGRAGRRGKDTEGTVVLLRNRFEDVEVAHKVLTSPVDGIRSHFKISYSLTVKLLETKTMDECKELIQRGFASYMMQKREKKKRKKEEHEVEVFRKCLRDYTLPVARDYLKLLRRLEKETKNEEYLLEKLTETENDLVQAIAEYMPLGVGLVLRTGVSGYFLGEVRWGAGKSGYGLLTRSQRLLVAQKEHIRSFAEADDSIETRHAQTLLSLVEYATDWTEVPLEGCKKQILEAKYSLPPMTMDNTDLEIALQAVERMKPMAPPMPPGAMVKQRKVIEDLEQQLREHPVGLGGDGELVLQALRYAAGLKDPVGFVNSVSQSTKEEEIFAWGMFLNTLKVLEEFKAMDGTRSTELGQLVGSISADNELWLGLALNLECVQTLGASELAAVVCALTVDGFKAGNSFFRHSGSAKVQEVFGQLGEIALNLKIAQSSQGIEFPVYMTTEIGGLVEFWCSGASWRELCKDTSLDQGDLCRMLRRTLEVLRQLPKAAAVPPRVIEAAIEAVSKMDRFPVADLETSVGEGSGMSSEGDKDVSENAVKYVSGVGFSVEGESVEDVSFQGLDLLDSMFEDDGDLEEEVDRGGGQLKFRSKTESSFQRGAWKGRSGDDRSDADKQLGLDLDELLAKIESRKIEMEEVDVTVPPTLSENNNKDK